MKSNESIQHKSLTREASPEGTISDTRDKFSFDGMKMNKYLSRNHGAA